MRRYPSTPNFEAANAADPGDTRLTDGPMLAVLAPVLMFFSLGVAIIVASRMAGTSPVVGRAPARSHAEWGREKIIAPYNGGH